MMPEELVVGAWLYVVRHREIYRATVAAVGAKTVTFTKRCEATHARKQLPLAQVLREFERSPEGAKQRYLAGLDVQITHLQALLAAGKSMLLNVRVD